MTDAASTGPDAEGGAPGVRAVVFDLDCARAAGAVSVHARWSAHAGGAPEHPFTAYRPAGVITALASAGPGRTPPGSLSGRVPRAPSRS